MEKESQESTEKTNRIAQMLVDLRNNWSDEIPDKSVGGASKKRFYKVRKNWFTEVNMALKDGELYGLFSDDFNRDIQKFSNFVTGNEFKMRMTTKEDIDMANQIIDRAISELGIG